MQASELMGAADVLQREANRFEQLKAAAEAFRDAASVIGQLEEAQRTLADLRGKLEAVRQEWREAQVEVAAARDKAKAVIATASEDANARAREISEASRVAAERAVLEAAAVVEGARAEGKGMIAAAQTISDKAQKEQREFTEALAGLKAEVAAKQNALVKIEESIKSAQAKIAAFATA